MTLTTADLRGDAVAPTVDADPVKALLGATRDGLLDYHGTVSGERYEVDIAGRRRRLTAAQSLAAVQRLRAVASLNGPGVTARLDAVRDGDVHAVRIEGDLADLVVDLGADVVVDWCAGFVAGQLGQGQQHIGNDRIGEIADLIEHPTLDDQCRMVILGLMHDAPDGQMTRDDLAAKLGTSKKTAVDALSFGRSLTSTMAEKMIKAFGLEWSVSASGRRGVSAGSGEPVEPLPEMPAMARLRRLVVASRLGWLRYDDQPTPNKARALRRYRLSVGPRFYVVDADRLDPWLDGLTAFHKVRGGIAQG